MRSWLLVVSLCVMGCSGKFVTLEIADSGGEAGSSDASAADASTSDGGNPTTCKDGGATAVPPNAPPAFTCPQGEFPTFDRVCFGDGDCASILHQIDCCGSMAAVGHNKTLTARFEKMEQEWQASCPRCRCAAKPPVADDGKSGDPDAVRVRCEKSDPCGIGACKTFFP